MREEEALRFVEEEESLMEELEEEAERVGRALSLAERERKRYSGMNHTQMPVSRQEREIDGVYGKNTCEASR